MVFGGAPPWEQQSAHTTDWWLAFKTMDDQVAAELQERANKKP